jgi:type IX secretion system PorP/SprF family membrane protein
MRRRFTYFMIMSFSLISAMSFGQGLHFSQYFNSPLLVNPANTGFAPDVDYRVGINYRNQWSSLTTNPYKTMNIWGDVQLFSDRFENGWVGLGGTLLKDAAGAGNLSVTRAYGSIAYHQLLGYASLLSVGFNVGYVSKKVDFNKLTFDNQWNGKFFDATIPTGESFSYSSIGFADLQAGINYAYFPNDNTYLNAGISMMHINGPTESFFEQDPSDSKVPVRFNVFLNGAFKLNDQWIVNPNLYYSKMGNASEIVFGANANYNLSGDGTTQLIGGMYFRKNDAIIPMVGYQWNDFKLTVNYDATTSDLKLYNNTRGAYELSLVKTGLFDGTKAVKCPTVKF